MCWFAGMWHVDIFKVSVNRWMGNFTQELLECKVGCSFLSFATSKTNSSRTWIFFWLAMCDVNHLEFQRPGDFSSTMQPYGKLISLFFQIPHWQRKSLYLLHSSFWSPSLSSYLCICVPVCWLLVFPLGGKRTSEKHLVGSSQPVVQITVCSPHWYIFPQATFNPNQWRHITLKFY